VKREKKTRNKTSSVADEKASSVTSPAAAAAGDGESVSKSDGPRRRSQRLSVKEEDSADVNSMSGNDNSMLIKDVAVDSVSVGAVKQCDESSIGSVKQRDESSVKTEPELKHMKDEVILSCNVYSVCSSLLY